MKEIKGIIISLNQFGDYDQMVSLISNEGYFSFLAKGTMKINSKNRPSVELLTYGNYLLTSSKKGYSLRQGTIIRSIVKSRSSYEGLKYISFISELCSKFILKEDASKAFPFLDKTIELIENGFSFSTATLLFLASIIRINGYGLEVDKCVRSGKQNDLVAISYVDGGFVNRDYYIEGQDIALGKRGLEIMRYIFKAKVDDFPRVTFLDEEAIPLIKELSSFLSDNSQVKINSVNYL